MAGQNDSTALSEIGAKSAQKLSQLQRFYRSIPAGTHGPACIFWANLAPFSLEMGVR
jgi:hypothetical protein